jgi:uncharacterized protein YidB (DUF937 family)
LRRAQPAVSAASSEVAARPRQTSRRACLTSRQIPQPPTGQPQGGFLGGLGSLVERFQQNGHGDVINSWIGSGQNQPITPDQLHQALGPDAVNNLSRMTGVSSQDLVSELSRVLPGIVDKLTPQGRMPDHAEMSRW